MKWSRVGLLALGASFATGLVSGGAWWLQARDDAPRATAGVAVANGVHVVLALGVVLALVRWRQHTGAALRVPFGEPWWRTFAGALSATRHRLRLVPVAAVLLVLFVVTLFCPFRAGQQVLAGLDHNFVVNAWGGPSYLGAALAHWLDLALLFYGLTGLMAWLGGRILSAPGGRATAAGPPS